MRKRPAPVETSLPKAGILALLTLLALLLRTLLALLRLLLLPLANAVAQFRPALTRLHVTLDVRLAGTLALLGGIQAALQHPLLLRGKLAVELLQGLAERFRLFSVG